LAQELDRLDVLASAELVRHPLAVRARVIEIEHRGDGIHAETVDVVLLEPEQRVREQEIADFVSSVIENQRAPVTVLALPGIDVLVEARSIEARETMRVLWKMAGDPVENDADAVLMARIHKRLEFLRRSKTARRRVKPGDL